MWQMCYDIFFRVSENLRNVSEDIRSSIVVNLWNFLQQSENNTAYSKWDLEDQWQTEKEDFYYRPGNEFEVESVDPADDLAENLGSTNFFDGRSQMERENHFYLNSDKFEAPNEDALNHSGKKCGYNGNSKIDAKA